MTDKPTPTDAVALARYKVVPAHESMFHRFAVVAGDGKQQLYLGREVECENMARKFAGAFLDGAFYQANITPSTQAAWSVPAVEREQERIAFKDAHRHLELYEVPDAWGRPMFKHSHVEASWLGWIARASHGQAPAGAGMGHTDGGRNMFYEGRFDGESQREQQARLRWANDMRAAFERHTGNGWFDKDWRTETGLWSSAWHACLAAQPTTTAQAADSVQEDAARLDWLLLRISGAEFRRLGVHYSGNARRADVDAARKQGENHDR